MNTLCFPWLERAGRLGNQLWQIASTLGIARRHGWDPMFPPGWAYRPYFSVPDSMFGSQGGHRAIDYAGHLHPAALIYLQDLWLWADHAEEVRTIFRPSPLATDSMSRSANEGLLALAESPLALGVHVRRCDAVYQPQAYPLPTLLYYSMGIGAHPDHDVFVFSDDAKWCREVLVPALHPRPITVVDGVGRPHETDPAFATAPYLDWIDVFALARCQAHVLSNSTFGWWGAFLSGSDDVTMPWPWYGPGIPNSDPRRMFWPKWSVRRTDNFELAEVGVPE